jgi:hypothetical protein
MDGRPTFRQLAHVGILQCQISYPSSTAIRTLPGSNAQTCQNNVAGVTSHLDDILATQALKRGGNVDLT